MLKSSRIVFRTFSISKYLTAETLFIFILNHINSKLLTTLSIFKIKLPKKLPSK